MQTDGKTRHDDRPFRFTVPVIMKQRPLILLVDADAGWRTDAVRELRERGHEVNACAAIADLADDPGARVPDLLIVDAASLGPVRAALPWRQAHSAACPVMVLADVYDEQAVAVALDAGAADFFVRSTQWALLAERIAGLRRIALVKHELADSRDRLAQVHSLAGAGTFDFDLASSTLRGSTGSFAILGLDVRCATVGAEDFLRLVPVEYHERLAHAVRRSVRQTVPLALDVPVSSAGGESMTMRIVAEPLCGVDGRVEKLRGVMCDVTESRRAEADIERLTNVDPLTGLPNRNRFLEQCSEAIASARSCGHGVAVATFDLDRFAQINESLGQTAGDEVLRIVAGRLESDLDRLRGLPGDAERAAATNPASLARLPGDRFAVLFPGVREQSEVAELVQEMVRGFARPLTVEGAECFVSCCVGVALYPRDGDAAGALLSGADAALSEAKRRGSRSVAWHARPPERHGRARLRLLSGLHKAVERGELSLRYQAWVDVANGTLGGVEALARWQHDGVSVPPVQFIALAEQSGLIVPIGEWAIREASRQMQAWREGSIRVPRVSVNISTIHFEQRSLVETVRDAIAECRLEPGMLEIELTESCMVRDLQRTLETFDALRDLGVALSLDDFGIGYSSLSYLTRLPIAKLKIDRSFVRMLGMSAEGESVVGAIIALGRSLRLQLVAEGVETVAQARALLDSGCHAMQGFLFAPPVLAAQLPEVARSLSERCRSLVGTSIYPHPERASFACHGRIA